MLDKALTVEANQFSLDAVKMIVLTGGNTVRTND
jgi:ribosomal protein L18E